MTGASKEQAGVEAVELRRIELPLVEPFVTSYDTQYTRDVLLVRVHMEGIDGWGECVAGSEPTYSPEYADGAEAVVRDHLLPRLYAAGPISAEDLAAALAPISGHRMAKAALEAALLDVELRLADKSLAERLGANRQCVPVGVAVGISDSVGELVERVGRYLDEGYPRVKLKIRPGWDRTPVLALRREFGDEFGLQADANGAYSPDDFEPLIALEEFGLLLIEQPFGAEQLLAHVDLAQRLETPVCLDESVVSEEVAADVIEMRAADVIAIKPGRVGGHLAGARIHDLCVAAGVPAWHGGMLETGIGRAANLALAALPGFTLPGDISAAARYWQRDIVTEPAILNADGTIDVPTGPGNGITVDLDYLDSITTRRSTLRPDR